jgi:hypothetical protein
MPWVTLQVEKCGVALTESGILKSKRREQGRYWMWNSLEVRMVLLDGKLMRSLKAGP